MISAMNGALIRPLKKCEGRLPPAKASETSPGDPVIGPTHQQTAKYSRHVGNERQKRKADDKREDHAGRS